MYRSSWKWTRMTSLGRYVPLWTNVMFFQDQQWLHLWYVVSGGRLHHTRIHIQEHISNVMTSSKMNDHVRALYSQWNFNENPHKRHWEIQLKLFGLKQFLLCRTLTLTLNLTLTLTPSSKMSPRMTICKHFRASETLIKNLKVIWIKTVSLA